MVDLQEPRKLEYSEKDQLILNEQFILLLHTMLLAYLGLHNFFIPVVSNLLRNQSILQDVHFWFLFQLPVQWFLRRKVTIPRSYFYFLVLGSVARLVLEFYFASTLKSWGILSVLVSELSSVIFYFLYFPALPSGKFPSKALSSILIVSILSFTELHSQPSILLLQKTAPTIDASHLGCEGSEVNLKYPLSSQGPVKEAIAIKPCGFSQKLVSTDSSFKVINETNTLYNLRLYKIHVLHGRVKWKFIRLIQLEPHKVWDVSSYLKNDVAYVIKSPEHRKLGHLVILPIRSTEFPLGKGVLSLTFDTLKWSSYE